MRRQLARALVTGFAVVASFGCSGSSNESNSNAGGNSTMGGAATGGASKVGSSIAGGSYTGGRPSTGGVSSTGVTATTGGVSSAGGVSSTGGTLSKGGSTASGGTLSKGGSTASGGSSTAGGTTATGGISSNGGTHALGGSTTSGGVSSTGGAGGASSGGVSTSTGGASTAGGSSGVTAAGVRWIGRVDVSNPSQPAFSYSETGFVAAFTGTGVTVQLSNGGDFYYTAVVDGTTVNAMLHGANGTVTVTAASNLSAGTHTLEFYRQSESAQGISTFKGITVTGGTLNAPPSAPARFIEFIGDSISCGYGDLCNPAGSGFKTSQESSYDSWGAVAARSLAAEVSIVARSGIGIYRDNTGSKTNIMANVYGQTHYSQATPAWGFANKPQAVVVNLGTNDFAQGDPGQTNYEGAMLSFVKAIRTKYPDAYIFLTIGSMLGGTSYTNCAKYLQDVVTQSNDTKVSYFALQTQTSADYGCDTHPNVNRQKIMGEAAAAAIKAKLGW